MMHSVQCAVLILLAASIISTCTATSQTGCQAAALCNNLIENQDVHLSCQLSVQNCLSSHNAWLVNNTKVNVALYNLSTTCTSMTTATTSLIFTLNLSTLGCYKCRGASTSSLQLHSDTGVQSCDVPLCIGVNCSDTGARISTSSTPSTPSLQQPQIPSSITTTQQFPISAPSSTQAVPSALVTSSPALSSPTPAPSQFSPPTLQIPLSIVYAAGACILLLLIVFVLVLVLTCTFSCWKKQSSLRITADQRGTGAEKANELHDTEIKTTVLCRTGSQSYSHASSLAPVATTIQTSSPDRLTPTTPSTPPTPQSHAQFLQVPPANSATGYNKLYVANETPTVLQHPPSPEAAYSQLNVTTGEDAPRLPVPVAIPLPPRVPPSVNSQPPSLPPPPPPPPDDAAQLHVDDQVAANEHLYFSLETPAQPSSQPGGDGGMWSPRDENTCMDNPVDAGHIYQVLDVSGNAFGNGVTSNQVHLPNEQFQRRANTLQLPPPPPPPPAPLHSPNDYAEINVSRVAESRSESPVPPPPPRQPPPPSKPPPAPPSQSPPLPPPPPRPSHLSPVPPPWSPPPPPLSSPSPPSWSPPPPPPPSRPPPSSPPQLFKSPPHPKSPSSTPLHAPTDYEDISIACVPSSTLKSNKTTKRPAEYEIPLSKTLPRRTTMPLHDPGKEESSDLVRGFSTSSPRPFVAAKQQRSFRGLHHSKPLTLSCDKLSTKEENKKDEMSSSTLHRQNSQKVKMTILHNDRIKITPTSQRPSVTPQHCAVTPPDYTHKQTHSPMSEEQPFIALNDEPSFVADYDRLRSNS